MSYRFLKVAWEADLPTATKFVLVSLADQANDDGVCWPGQESIARRTGLTTRAVINNLAKLETAGWISVERRGGNGEGRKTNIYRLSERRSHRGNVNEVHQLSEPDDRLSEPGSPKPLVEPSVKPSEKNTRKKEPVLIPDFIDGELWMDWVKHRAEIRKPLKPTTITHQVRQLVRWREQGHDPNEIIRYSIGNGYVGLFEPKTKKSGESIRERSERLAREMFGGSHEAV